MHSGLSSLLINNLVKVILKNLNVMNLTTLVTNLKFEGISDHCYNNIVS